MVAAFVGIDSEPGAGAATGAQRILIELRRLVETPRSAALATRDQIGQIAGGAHLVEPELATATLFGTVDEAGPVEVIHMSSRAGTHEAGGHHGKAVEASLVVEPLAVHQTPGTLGPVAAAGLLHDEPFRKPPCPDAPRGCPRLVSVPEAAHRASATGHRSLPRACVSAAAPRFRPGCPGSARCRARR